MMQNRRDIMKKVILVVLLFMLTGCTSNDKNYINNFENANDDSYLLQKDKSNNGVTSIEMSVIELYPTFESMINSEFGQFYLLNFEYYEEFAEFANSYYFRDLLTNELHEVVHMKGLYDFKVGELYIIHMVHPDNNEFFHITDVYSGIFTIDDNIVGVPDKYEEECKNISKSLSDFLVKVNVDFDVNKLK
jgi:hypothetical protein